MIKNMSFNIFNKKYLKYMSTHKDKEVRGFVIGTPVIVLDIKIDKKIEFSSISEAARYFNTYPKTIWRVVYGNKLYLDRYKIVVKTNKALYNISYIRYIKRIYSGIEDNKFLIYYIILIIILGAILYVFIYYFVLVYKEIYSDYIINIQRVKANHLRYMLEHSFIINSNEIKISKPISINKISRFVELNKEWRSEAKLGIYQSIVNEVNLNFTSMVSPRRTDVIYSSPIIERIDINNVFNNIVTNTINELSNNNSFATNSNRNSLTLNTSVDIFRDKVKNRELLNYQSNILYLLINKISPSIY